jgi:hypothetical protein
MVLIFSSCQTREVLRYEEEKADIVRSFLDGILQVIQGFLPLRYVSNRRLPSAATRTLSPKAVKQANLFSGGLFPTGYGDDGFRFCQIVPMVYLHDGEWD